MVSTTIFIDGSQVQSLLKDVILIIIHLCLENLNFPPHPIVLVLYLAEFLKILLLLHL